MEDAHILRFNLSIRVFISILYLGIIFISVTGEDLCKNWSGNVRCERLELENGEVCYVYTESLWGSWRSSSATFVCTQPYELSASVSDYRLNCARKFYLSTLSYDYYWDGTTPECVLKATKPTTSRTASLTSPTRIIPTSTTLASTTSTKKITMTSPTSTTTKLSSSTTFDLTTAKTTSSTRNSSHQTSTNDILPTKTQTDTKQFTSDAKDADNSLAVSVAVPIVVVLTLIACLTVFVVWRRRSFNNCWSRKEPVEVHAPSAVENLAYEEHPTEKLDIHVFENDKKDKTVYENPITISDNNVHYEISIKEEEPKHDYSHLAKLHSEFVDPKYSHIKESTTEINRHIADVPYSHINNNSSLHNQYNALDSSDEVKRDGNKEKQENLQDPEYDHAVSGNRDAEPSGPDQYFHLNQVEQNRGRTGQNSHYDYAKTGQEDNNCSKVAENNYFVLEKEAENQSTPQLDANSHDYFVLGKIEHCT